VIRGQTFFCYSPLGTGRLFFSDYVNILWVSQYYVYMSNVSTCASSTATRRKQVGNISTSIVLVIKLKRNTPDSNVYAKFSPGGTSW
jgi:hypothetical protein